MSEVVHAEFLLREAREALCECLGAALQIRTLISYTSPFQGPDRAVRVSDLKPVAARIESAFDAGMNGGIRK